MRIDPIGTERESKAEFTIVIEIHVEICSKCHPFYTGQQKASSTRGRIDKFNKKYGVSNN